LLLPELTLILVLSLICPFPKSLFVHILFNPFTSQLAVSFDLVKVSVLSLLAVKSQTLSLRVPFRFDSKNPSEYPGLLSVTFGEAFFQKELQSQQR
jgi:hypothetical protein